MATASADTLVDRLRLHGPTPARPLLDALGVSQPTLSRLVRSAGPRLVRIGRARRTRYAAVREVRTLGHAWPVYRVDAAGRIAQAATLHALYPRAWWYDTPSPPAWLHGEFSDGMFPDLPWFLDDLRPQGFLGRAFARRHADRLRLGPDPQLWDADGVLAAILAFGDDVPGDVVVGDAAAERVQRAMLREPESVREDERAAWYEAAAVAALAGDVAGSSAGGEQPKFPGCVLGRDGMHRHVLVKFSPPLETPVGRRWADLLACEQLAAETLRAHGVAACETEWVEGPQRAFLEVRRFDRVGAHGRRGVVSLFAMESAYYGLLDTWSAAAERMARDGWLASDDAETLRLRWLFGQLIANADMHFANVSLLLDGERPLALAPSYDMLPMHYRPSVAGEIVARPFDPAPPPPRHRVAWSRTAGIAMDFWGRVAEDPRVSDGFRREAGRNRQAVRSVAERFAGH